MVLLFVMSYERPRPLKYPQPLFQYLRAVLQLGAFFLQPLLLQTMLYAVDTDDGRDAEGDALNAVFPSRGEVTGATVRR